MNILLVGGFFGSGKTTVISRLVKQMLADGKKLCIIENEIGKNAIDDLLLQNSSVEISTITGGCVCCQVTGSLIEALHDLRNRFSPDWIIVELTGIAFLNDLREKILKYLKDSPPVLCITIVDAARWQELLKAAQIIMEKQVGGGDIIVINKTDLNPEIEPIREDICHMAAAPQIIPLSAASDSCRSLLKAVEREVSSRE
ncbi:MAG: GTP-binding protein [Ruminococcus sp.]|jgi:G3E family GTPase